MKKFFLSTFVVVTFALYSLSQMRVASSGVSDSLLPIVSPQPSGPITDPTTTNTPVTITPNPEPTPNPTPSPVPTPTPVPKGQYTDGTYTGPSTDAFYGFIQVRVSIQNGKISDIAFLSYPNDRGESREINGQALPYLKQEAIAAQSANVDIISGATQTSIAFRQSLASALTQAKS